MQIQLPNNNLNYPQQRYDNHQDQQKTNQINNDIEMETEKQSLKLQNKEEINIVLVYCF